MAKKKRKTPKKSPSRPPRGKSDEPMPGPPDPRAMEGVMWGVGFGRGGRSASPLDQAQEIMYDAFDASKPEERIALALQALEVSADCADAYALLAEYAPTRKEALSLYEQAVDAGVRSLGPKTFKRDVGHFWGLLETRPYMRARLGLADTLWALGRQDEAAEHLVEMLRLNPNDNQGLRYILAPWLVTLGRDDELDRLLTSYEDDGSATWAYTRLLLAFRRQAGAPALAKLLKEALLANEHVPDFLLGAKPVPREQPPYYSRGDESEAVLYAATGLSGWKSTPGATTWLREAAAPAKPKARKPKAAKVKMPTAAAKKRLAKLPMGEDTWQVDGRMLAQWIEVEGERLRPWMILVINVTDDLVLGNAIADADPGADQLWEALALAIQTPSPTADLEPHRPARLQVRPDPRWEALRPHVEAIGIELEELEELEHMDAVFESLIQHLSSDAPPGLLDMPGVEPNQVAGFFDAAAHFYRKAPWRALGFEEAIRIEADKFESGPWYAVIMGQAGLTLGLALYEDLDLLRKLWASDLSDEENARRTVALTITYDHASESSAVDVDAAERLGWEVAGPEAFPTIFRKERGMSIRPPLTWELELMEGCLRALPEFVARHKPGDTQSYPMVVPVNSDELRLTLAWIESA